jgi:hypothetical protein
VSEKRVVDKLSEALLERARVFVALGIIIFLAVTARELSPQWLMLLASMLGIFTIRRTKEPDDDEPDSLDHPRTTGLVEPTDPA